MESNRLSRAAATATPALVTPALVNEDRNESGSDWTERVSGAEVVRFSQLLLHLKASIQALDCSLPPEVGHLAPHQVRVLMHLAHNSGHTVSELAESLGISLGWASRIIDELEQGGCVERERDLEDRRVVRLRLSARSQAIADRMFRERGSLVGKALSELAPDERESVARFLRRISTEMENLNARPG